MLIVIIDFILSKVLFKAAANGIGRNVLVLLPNVH